MAYGLKYHFRWESQNGNDYQLDLAQKNYEGPVYERRLGQAPVLRRDASERIWGSSLELFIECQVDQEFADMYTTDPADWRAQLFDSSGSLIWQGFVSPELYSEPDILPPYDVQIIATDGIGELKFIDFDSSVLGGADLQTLIGHLLSKTGFPVTPSSLLLAGKLSILSVFGSQSLPPYSLNLDLSHFDGETCYDVLTKILELLNAVILQQGGRWWIVRESDINNQSFARVVSNPSARALSSSFIKELDGSAPSSLPVFPGLGSMNSAYSWWPVGQFTTEVEAAKRRVSVECPYEYRPNVNSIDWDDWTFRQSGSGDQAWLVDFEHNIARLISHNLNGASVSQTVYNWPSHSNSEARLTIGAVYDGNVNSVTSPEDPCLKVQIKNTQTDGRVYYLIEDVTASATTYIWDEDPDYIKVAVPEGYYFNPNDITIVFPATSAGRLDITLTGAKGRYIYVHYASLSADSAHMLEGEKAVVTINNGARSEMEELSVDYSIGNQVDSLFRKRVLTTSSGVRTTDIYNISGALHTSETSITRFLAVDRAIQVALPRLVCKGVVNVPAGQMPPLGFMKGGNAYLLKTFSWNLLDDEMEIEAISFPSPSVDTSGWIITTTNQS